jgi:hypothetical protein
MFALLQPRLVKMASTSAQANTMQLEPSKGPTETIGKRFLAALMSALSGWSI